MVIIGHSLMSNSCCLSWVFVYNSYIYQHVFFFVSTFWFLVSPLKSAAFSSRFAKDSKCEILSFMIWCFNKSRRNCYTITCCRSNGADLRCEYLSEEVRRSELSVIEMPLHLSILLLPTPELSMTPSLLRSLCPW